MGINASTDNPYPIKVLIYLAKLSFEFIIILAPLRLSGKTNLCY